MATVLPFKGIRYNPKIIDDLSAVTTPPYDVISADEQDEFYRRHPNNVIRLILNRTESTDTRENNPHTRSATHFKQWMSDGILKQDDTLSLYVKAITYTHEGHDITRFGLIALVGVEPFEKRIVLPHEKTYSKVKSERLGLIKATRCNYCPIFSLYPDDGSILTTITDAIDTLSPVENFTDEQGHRHRLWQIVDPEIHRNVTKAMVDKRLFIADGHHRYETALNYRNFLQETDPAFDEHHPANYVMMYLCSMSDPGLNILPAHRLVKDLTPEEMKRAIETSRSYFQVTPYPFTTENRRQVEKEFLAALETGSDKNCIGIYAHGSSVFYLLKLNAGVMDQLFEDELSPPLRRLDVTVLTRLIFMKILGFNQERLDDETLIGYASTSDKALKAIDDGNFDVAFILNPTRIEQVQEVAQKGLIMPRKSTYFYPKVRSGLVMNTLVP